MEVRSWNHLGASVAMSQMALAYLGNSALPSLTNQVLGWPSNLHAK